MIGEILREFVGGVLSLWDGDHMVLINLILKTQNIVRYVIEPNSLDCY